MYAVHIDTLKSRVWLLSLDQFSMDACLCDFIHVFVAVLGLHRCEGLSLAAVRGLPFDPAPGLLTVAASLPVARRLWGLGLSRHNAQL